MNTYRHCGPVEEIEFKDWWNTFGLISFWERKIDFVRELKSPGEDLRERVVISVPLCLDLEDSIQQIRRILQPKVAEYHFDKKNFESDLHIIGNPQLGSLKNTLSVCKAKMENPAASNADIAIAARLSLRSSTSGGRSLADAQSEEVARYLKKGKALIFNVGCCLFPSLASPPPDYLAPWERGVTPAGATAKRSRVGRPLKKSKGQSKPFTKLSTAEAQAVHQVVKLDRTP